MAEYKVKFRIKEDVLFGLSGESVEIYEAESAKDAIELCKSDFRLQTASVLEDLKLTILDVERV